MKLNPSVKEGKSGLDELTDMKTSLGFGKDLSLNFNF